MTQIPTDRLAEVTNDIVRDVCELADCVLPDDQPDILQCTVEELSLIVSRNVQSLSTDLDKAQQLLAVEEAQNAHLLRHIVAIGEAVGSRDYAAIPGIMRSAALHAAPDHSEQALELVEVFEVETVSGDFLTEPGDPFWHIVVGGYCADFKHKAAAENFAAAVNRLITCREQGAAEAERERCAKEAEDTRTDDDSLWDRAAQTIADAIRALPAQVSA